MTKFVMCLAILAACPLLAAQQAPQPGLPPTAAEVMNYFEVMHVREQSQAMIQAEQNQVKIMVQDMFKKQMPGATAEQHQKFQHIMDGAINDIFKDYPVDDILRDLIPVYQHHLTESDLNAVVAFYSSPVGQKLRRETPAMAAEAMRVSYGRLQPKIEDMMKNIDARVKEMASQEKKASPGKGSSTPKN